jgi:hypothetical protein
MQSMRNARYLCHLCVKLFQFKAFRLAHQYSKSAESLEMFQTVSNELPEGEPGSRVGIVGEIRLTPVWHKPLKMWLLYHLEHMGFEHIILYVDINKQNLKNDTVCEVLGPFILFLSLSKWFPRLPCRLGNLYWKSCHLAFAIE